MAYYWKNKNDKFITIFTANEHKCSQTLIGHIVMSMHLSVCVFVCIEIRMCANTFIRI